MMRPMTPPITPPIQKPMMPNIIGGKMQQATVPMMKVNIQESFSGSSQANFPIPGSEGNWSPLLIPPGTSSGHQWPSRSQPEPPTQKLLILSGAETSTLLHPNSFLPLSTSADENKAPEVMCCLTHWKFATLKKIGQKVRWNNPKKIAISFKDNLTTISDRHTSHSFSIFHPKSLFLCKLLPSF